MAAPGLEWHIHRQHSDVGCFSIFTHSNPASFPGPSDEARD
ncbi:hypothetical protein FHW21_006759 [Paraburkholderia sp. WP4_3_2]|nr:hypothetical protein [Paraburkholderia sp. WP4_3_2]